MKVKKLLNFWQRTSPLLGIEITHNQFRLIGLSYTNGHYFLEASLALSFNEPLTNDDLIIKTLSPLLQKLNLPTKKAAIALCSSEVILKEAEVDTRLSSLEIEKFLQFTLLENLAEKKETGKSSFDYQIINKTNTKHGNKLLQVAIAPKTLIERWQNLFKRLHLQLKIIDIDCYAVARALSHQLKNIKEPTMIIMIDAKKILTAVVIQENIVYNQVDFISSELSSSITSLAEQLTKKIEQVISLLKRSIAKLILAGEKAPLPGLVELIAARTKIQTLLANPFLGMKLSPQIAPESVVSIAPLMLISCGLALRVKYAY